MELKNLKMKMFALVACLMAVPSLFAAPAKGGAADPVAEGYPAWTGITPKNYISGRLLVSDAELRQRVATVVVEFDAAKTAEQLEQTGSLAAFNNVSSVISESSNWETIQIPHDVMVIFVAHNAKTHETVTEGMKQKNLEKFPGLIALKRSIAPIYEKVTFEGAPSNGGKFPFVYVMGCEGKEPLLKEAFGEKTKAAVAKAISAQRKKMMADGLAWRPFFGYVAEPKHLGKELEKALAKGKPIEPVEAKIKRGVTAKDPEAAKEAQMIYDALQQTRGDMIMIVRHSCGSSPHVAAYTMGRVLKCWPKSKKMMAEAADKIKANGSAQPLIRIYTKLKEWSDPDFTCKNAGEAKKIVAELQKMKKQILPLTSDPSVTIQNGALVLDGMLDELIAIIPTKVPQK